MTTDKISAKQQRCFHFLNLMYGNRIGISTISGVDAMKMAGVGVMTLTMARRRKLVDDTRTRNKVHGEKTAPKWVSDTAPTQADAFAVCRLMSEYNAANVVKAQRANEVKPPQGTPVSLGALTNAMELERTRGQMKLCVDTLKLLAIEEHRLLRLI